MSGSPRWGRWLVRGLLPAALAEAIEGDLEEGFRKRAAGGRLRRLRAHGWFWWQVITMPYASLARGSTGREGRMTGWTRDLRSAARALRRRPAFAVAGTLTLALTLGVATLLFSVAEGVVLRPLPYGDPGRVVTLYLLNETWRDSDNELLRQNWAFYNVTPRHVAAFRELPGPLADAGFAIPSFRELQISGERAEGRGLRVDARVFPTLGIEPALGRLPTPEEHATGARVAVLRDDLWRERFGARSDALGTTFRYGDELYSVIGVMPRGFYFPAEHTGHLWTPIPPEESDFFGFGVGRLAPGITAAEASVGLDRIARRLGEDDAALAHFGARAVPTLEAVTRHVRSGMLLLLGTAVIVLLAACANLANLVLARGVRRRGEMAVRAALGASRASLARTALAEVGLVTLLGASAGLAFAAVATRPFVDALSSALQGLPRSAGVGLNGTVVAFAAAATVGTMLIAGLPGALGAWAGQPGTMGEAGARRGSGRASSRARRVLLACQAALAATVLAGAGLLVTSAARAGTVPLGFDPEGLAWLEVRLADAPTRGSASAPDARALEDALSLLPGVVSASLASRPPIGGGLGLSSIRPVRAPDEEARQVSYERVSERHFRTLGLPVLLGDVGGSSSGDAPRVALSESLARTLAGSGSPLGMRVIRGDGDDAVEAEVVAVVGGARQFLLVEPVEHFYVLEEGLLGRTTFALLRTGGDPAEVLAVASAAVTRTLPGAEVSDRGTVRSAMDEALRPLRLRALLVSLLSGLAALLTVIGIAGLAAHFLGEQRREIAIRLTLGAEPRREVRRVVGHVLLPTMAGLALGLALAAALSGALADLVWEVSPTDPLVYALVGALLSAVAALAAWIPGRRATAVQPAHVLDEG